MITIPSLTQKLAVVLGIFLALPTAIASLAPPALDAVQRDRLRFKLENLFNEQDLMIRNQRVDASDVAHQRRQFAELKVFDRIPFIADLPGLLRDLTASAEQSGLQITAFQRLRLVSIPSRPVPLTLYTDEPRFKLAADQLAEAIPFKVIVRGASTRIREWVKNWPTHQLRITELSTPSFKSSVRSLHGGRWEIRATAYRYREIRFPTLKARDPVALLPRWAVADPKHFARHEPVLWEFVERIKNIAPRAKPLYRGRAEMLLNDARMSFFLSKVAPR